MTASLKGRHVLIVIAPRDFRDEELTVPRAFFEQRGAVVEVASTTTEMVEGMLGLTLKPDLTIDQVDPRRYSAIVVAGGSGTPTYLWENARLHALLRLARADGTPLGAICLAGAVLARAGLLQGVRATVYGEPRARHELERGGAFYVDDDVVVDQGIVTASGPRAAQAFADALGRQITDSPSPSARGARRARPAPARPPR